MVWQLTQELAKNTLRPAAALVFTEATVVALCIHSSGGCTTTRIYFGRAVPALYSAQLPGRFPGFVGSIHIQVFAVGNEKSRFR